MAVLKTPPTYDSRSVQEWLTMAARGQVLLPNFQRSVVWKHQATADYLKALLDKRPTGLFLILEASDPLQFRSRSLHGTDFSAGNTGDSVHKRRELVLDGQQRLTSLWGALTGTSERRYFVEVANLAAEPPDLEVERVFWQSDKWSNPAKMYRENCVPVDILWNNPGSSEPSGRPGTDSIRTWCNKATGKHSDALFEAVGEIRERLVIAPRLQYCRLDSDTGANTAIDIFIYVNRSVVKLKQVDIAVALAQADHDEDLRGRVEAYIGRSAEVPHYFNTDLKRTIPEVAEWILKVGCLKVRERPHLNGLPPKESNYPSAVRSLFGSNAQDPKAREAERNSRMKQMEADLDAALRFAAHRGGATKRTLPGWPPVHVIAALQEDARNAGPALQDTITQLMSAYLWRAWVTNRYERQANDRLLEDFRGLRRYFGTLATGNRADKPSPGSVVPAFNAKEHPIPKPNEIRRAGWIGRASRLGRAIGSVAMQGNPLDWVTGEKLDLDRVRELERTKKLARHHLFPPKLFEKEIGDKTKRGLNGVLLHSPKSLANRDPHDQLTLIQEGQPPVDELELRRRVDSHLVSYAQLLKDGAGPSFRYERFCKDRAQRVALKIEDLVRF